MIIIQLKASGLELTPPIRLYVEDKLRSLERLIPSEVESHATFEVERSTAHHQKGLVYRSEVNLNIGGELLRAEQRSEDLYASIDLVKDELLRELKSSKTRKESLFRKGARLAKRILRMN